MIRAVLVDAELDGAERLTARLRERGVVLDVYSEPLRALAHLGRGGWDAVVIAARSGVATATQVTSVVRDELNLPVLLAHDGADVDLIGPPVLAGARPLVGLPYDAAELSRVLGEVCPSPSTVEPTRIGVLRLDPAGCDARIDRQGLDLSALEFEVLHVLAENVDHVVERGALMSRWPDSADPDDKLVSVVGRLRRKLGRLGWPGVIHTVRGLGYRLESRALESSAVAHPSASISSISSSTRDRISSMMRATSSADRPLGSVIGQSR